MDRLSWMNTCGRCARVGATDSDVAGIPAWALVAGGVVVLGGAYVLSRRGGHVPEAVPKEMMMYGHRYDMEQMGLVKPEESMDYSELRASFERNRQSKETPEEREAWSRSMEWVDDVGPQSDGPITEDDPGPAPAPVWTEILGDDDEDD